MAVLLLPQSAAAQPKTLFDMLFGEKKAAPPEPPAPRQATPQRQAPVRKPIPPAPRKPSPARIPIPVPLPKHLVQKLDDANNVLILGDFSSSGLADGLTEAFNDNPSVRISDLSNGSSGFVRQDYYDWNQSIAALLEQEKPAAVVMMIGANDRQIITTNGKIHPFLSDEWTADYQARIDNFIKTVKGAGYPLIWVGQPPYVSRAMSKNMLALNEVYRRTAEQSGASFIDVWDGFTGEDGNATITGLDINGQDAQLRSTDGIGFTSAGKRKLAFYVEKPLRKILSVTEQQSEPNASATTETGIGLVSRINRLPAVSLRDYAADQSGVLLGAAPASATLNPVKPEKSYSPYPDRADYFRSITNK
ncbi:DUF459 domain-containing protein [Paenochrobactrum sp. BZR 588]|uniref:SGNH/GDSL hydrolase family protein n=1 Tax=unclassified Paenochrobactrum TaxID=2639760 RepID=UPI003851E3B2